MNEDPINLELKRRALALAKEIVHEMEKNELLGSKVDVAVAVAALIDAACAIHRADRAKNFTHSNAKELLLAILAESYDNSDKAAITIRS